MIVIACKYTAENPVIFSCVESCRRYLPEEKILVVDSNSDDKSYFSKLSEMVPSAEVFTQVPVSNSQLYIADVNNTGFDSTAYWIGYELFPEETFYYLIHDSCEFVDYPTEIFDRDITIFGTNNGYRGNHPESAYANAPIQNFPMGEPFVPVYLMNQTSYRHQLHRLYETNGYSFVFGPLMFIKRTLLDRLYQNNFHCIRVTTKQDSTDMERCWGIAFALEGYPNVPYMVSWAEIMEKVGPFDKGKVLQKGWFKKQWIKRT